MASRKKKPARVKTRKDWDEAIARHERDGLPLESLTLEPMHLPNVEFISDMFGRAEFHFGASTLCGKKGRGLFVDDWETTCEACMALAREFSQMINAARIGRVAKWKAYETEDEATDATQN